MEKLPEESILKLPELRQATPEDCLLMFRLQHLNGGELDMADKDKVAQFEKYQEEFDPTKIQVILSEKIAVGRLRIVRDGGSIYIGGFQILPEYRGQGIGTSILNDLVAESEQTGLPITLEVLSDNEEAIKLYEKIGFITTEKNDKQKTMKYEPGIVRASS